MKRKILSLALALVICLGLTVPAFASDLTGNQLYGEWGNGPSLILKGVTGQKETQLQLSVCYDVAVGGSMVLDLPFPKGANRVYGFMMTGVYANSALDDYMMTPDGNRMQGWEIAPEKMAYDITEADGRSQYVYNFTADEAVQLNGYDKLIYMDIYWGDDYDDDGQTENSGSVYFYLRVVPAPAATAGGFADVSATAWYADPVVWAVEQGITNGTGKTTFSPNRTCTQGEILTFLWRAQGEPAPTGTAQGTKFYAKAAQWAKEQGLTDIFDGEADCTRAMVVTYLWKLNGSPEVAASGFTDVPAGADYAQAVAWAVEQGITNGTGETTFSPNDTCTRGQIVTFLYRAFAD